MIKNLTKQTVITQHTEFFATSWSRFRGLMFRKVKPSVGYLFLFPKPTYAAIHMLFVPDPIDVLWLDRDGRVIDIAIHVKPWSLHTAPKGYATFMIELMAGSVVLSLTQVGDQIEF